MDPLETMYLRQPQVREKTPSAIYQFQNPSPVPNIEQLVGDDPKFQLLDRWPYKIPLPLLYQLYLNDLHHQSNKINKLRPHWENSYNEDLNPRLEQPSDRWDSLRNKHMLQYGRRM